MSQLNPMFRSEWGESIFRQKYPLFERWEDLARQLAQEVCEGFLPQSQIDFIFESIRDMKFIPGGRYLYYAGRKAKFYNNCFLLRAEEDSRQDWANLSWKAESCLMTGGGIGADYSVYRPKGSILGRTGGEASGPLPKMQMINEIGRNVMQGGSRRSAIYASLNWQHGDVWSFLRAKNWHDMKVPGTDKTVWDIRQADFNFPAPLDMTNISPNYDDAWLDMFRATGDVGALFYANVEQACMTGEPGFSFNFGEQENETLRNACTEVTSADDSDCCNLGSLNFSRIESPEELRQITRAATLFLLCGSHRSDVPYEKVERVREKNRRLGLGIMGIHEWLMSRGYSYGMNPEFERWLCVYKVESDAAAAVGAHSLSCARPKGVRAIAPTGTIGILAGTTTGIEPLYAVAYKRRVLTRGTEWVEKYVIDDAADVLIHKHSVDPDKIETSIDLAKDPERRIKFQYEVQKYVDHAISSTINLPEWGSESNNPDTVRQMASILAKYAHGLRGFTAYPDAARGGQPLTAISYQDAIEHNASVQTHDICSITSKGGVCGA